MADVTLLKLVMVLRWGHIWPETSIGHVEVLLGVSLWVILVLLTLQLSELMTLMSFIYFVICCNILLPSQVAKQR